MRHRGHSTCDDHAPAGGDRAAPTVTPAAGMCTVPDVVGMVHQAAQDTVQSVAAGQVVDGDTEVTLSAKKAGE